MKKLLIFLKRGNFRRKAALYIALLLFITTIIPVASFGSMEVDEDGVLLDGEIFDDRGWSQTESHMISALADGVESPGDAMPATPGDATPSDVVKAYYVYQKDNRDYSISQISLDGLHKRDSIELKAPQEVFGGSYEMPANKLFCQWLPVIVERPHVSQLATASEADVSYNIATGSDALLLRAGSQVNIETELYEWLNTYFEAAFLADYHDEYYNASFEELIGNRTQGTVTLKLSWDASIDTPVNISWKINGIHAGDTIVSGTNTYTLTVDRPMPGRTAEIEFNAYTNCKYCGDNIDINFNGPSMIEQQDIEISDPDPDPDPDPSPKPYDGSDDSSQSSKNTAEYTKITVDYSKPANSSGWYYDAPVININAVSGAVVYYKLWNKSTGQTEFSTSTKIYLGNQSFDFSEDGIYEVRIWSEQNGARSPEDDDILLEFKIDRKNPVVSVVYDNQSENSREYFKNARKATIIVEDANFNEAGVDIRISRSGQAVNQSTNNKWQNNGINHSVTVEFLQDGNYVMDVSATDTAGRTGSLEKTQRFKIDTVAPEVLISGVSDMTANSSAVYPVITYRDDNIDNARTAITLEGYKQGTIENKQNISYNDGKVVAALDKVSEDDNYMLDVHVYDLAGNVTEQKISFSINTKGATFVFRQKDFIVNGYTNKKFTPEVEVWNTDEINIVSVTVNGQSTDYEYKDGVVKYQKEINQEGKYILGLDVRDTAGNVSSMPPAEFIYDGTPPVVIISGVENQKTYDNFVIISAKTESSDDEIVDVILNGGKQSSDRYKKENDGSISLNLEDAGTYTIYVTATDYAGNTTSTEPISFSIVKNMTTASHSSPVNLLWLLAIILCGTVAAFFIKKKLKI